MGQILSLILRFLFAWIDAILAKLITKVYEILMDLANLMLSGDNIVKGIGQRLGLILGIFMLFRLAITLINYLISPDKLKDASKGGAKLITNIIFSLVLLGTVNVIFKEAYKVQKTLINSKIIENVFFGKSDQQNVDIGYYLYSSLFTPNEDAIGSDACSQLWDLTYRFSGSGCDLVLHNNLDISAVNAIADAKNTLSFSKVFSDYSLVTAHTGSITSGEFYFDYTPILSNAVGVIALLILISFCMDLALRAIKLLFLQIIAPIPIISNMDPGKGKDTFQKWYKECFKTYITVFIRLITINFAVFMLSLIKGNYKDIFNNNLLLNVFLIIGCLLFAKQVPKLIEDMFGIKLDGMVLHPMKRLQEQAVFGKNITSLRNAGISGAMGLGAGLIGAGAASKALGNGLGKNALSAAIGAGRGLVGGLGAGYKSKNTFDAFKTGIARKNSEAEHVNSLDGTTLGGRFKAGIQQRFSLPTDEEQVKKGLGKLGEYSSSIDAMLKRAEAESIKKPDLQIKDSGGNLLTMEQHKQEQERLTRMRNEDVMDFEEYAKSEGINTKIKDYNEFAQQFRNGMGRDANSSDYEAYKKQMQQMINSAREKHNNYKLEHDAELQRLNDKINKDTKIFANEYATQVSRGNITDAETKAYIENVKKTREELEKYIPEEQFKKDFDIFETYTDANGQKIKYVSGDKAKKSKGSADALKYSVEHSKSYETAKANAAATKPNKK